MEVVNDLLNYNKLKIVQNTDWFKFSLDSVLLANFVHTRPNDKIIDFCTGNAPIPLFLQHKVKNKILGVEYQKEIYELAIKSVCINKSNKRTKKKQFENYCLLFDSKCCIIDSNNKIKGDYFYENN